MGLRLTIELVPKTSWFQNVRAAIASSDWDVLRRRVYALYDYRCGICGAGGKLNCHELWEYDDSTHTQTLIGFIALCDWCHHVKHIGLSGILAGRGHLNYSKVVQHFMRVNNCTEGGFLRHKSQAFCVWRERSQFEWAVDLSLLYDMRKEGCDD